jgi:hypothetical protein
MRIAVEVWREAEAEYPELCDKCFQGVKLKGRDPDERSKDTFRCTLDGESFPHDCTDCDAWKDYERRYAAELKRVRGNLSDALDLEGDTKLIEAILGLLDSTDYLNGAHLCTVIRDRINTAVEDNV